MRTRMMLMTMDQRMMVIMTKTLLIMMTTKIMIMVIMVMMIMTQRIIMMMRTKHADNRRWRTQNKRKRVNLKFVLGKYFVMQF